MASIQHRMCYETGWGPVVLRGSGIEGAAFCSRAGLSGVSWIVAKSFPRKGTMHGVNRVVSFFRRWGAM